MTRSTRTSQGLRDLLFDEIEAVKNGGNTDRAFAVAMLARQIISTARVELEFHRAVKTAGSAKVGLSIGSMPLGSEPSTAASVEQNAMDHTQDRDHPSAENGAANQHDGQPPLWRA